MTSISFILTTCDAAAYVNSSLQSLAQSAQPGDEVLVVDDGSKDGTVTEIERAIEHLGWPSDVRIQTVFLGTRTPGGAGIPRDIGLAKATKHAVLFVDGRCWVEPDGIAAMRAYMEQSDPDILIGTYRLVDEVHGVSNLPAADLQIWRERPTGQMQGAVVDAALRLTPGPWRQLYRRSYLLDADLRFSDEKGFSEDVEFHWAACLSASRIDFADAIAVRRRLNQSRRADEKSDATESTFSQYERLLDLVASSSTSRPLPKSRLFKLADSWLAEVMRQDFQDIHDSDIIAYAAAAERALSLDPIRKARWSARAQGALSGSELGYYIDALLVGGATGLSEAWMLMQSLRQAGRTSALEARVAEIEKLLRKIDGRLNAMANDVTRLSNQLTFDALTRSTTQHSGSP